MAATFGATGGGSTGGYLDEKTGIFHYADGSTYQNPYKYGDSWSYNPTQTQATPAVSYVDVGAQQQTYQTKPDVFTAATPVAAPAPAPSPAPAPAAQFGPSGTAGNGSSLGGAISGISGGLTGAGAPSPGTAYGSLPGGAAQANPQGGLINSAITPWNVTAQQTVAGQLQGLTDPNSPFIAQARAQALQAANSRGLINSSIAQSAADAAAYQAALPVAQADAATYAKAIGYNADQANQMSTLDKNLANQWRQAQLQADTSRYNTDASSSTSRYNTDASTATSRYTAELQAQTQKLNNESSQLITRLNNDQQTLAVRLNNDNQKLLNTNRDAATAFNNSMQYINAINANDKMDADAKTRAIAAIYDNLQTQLRTLSKVSGIDVSGTLSLAGAPGFDAQGNYVGFGNSTGSGGSGGGGSTSPEPSNSGNLFNSMNR